MPRRSPGRDVGERHEIPDGLVSGRAVFLPPYSPDVNPIELAFATAKAALRRAEARSIAAVVVAVGAALAAVTAADARAFSRHAGFPA